MPVTTGMKGEGFYDQHSSPQFAAISTVLPWLEAAVGEMIWPDSPSPIVVVDYACSEGRNSIAAMQQIANAIREQTSRPIQVVHSDLHTNNFNQLFINLASAGSAERAAAQVYASAVAGSMFKQLMPSQTVTLATTFNAIGFLEHRPPFEIPDYILPMGPSRPRPGVGVSDEARKAFATQARDDLNQFYLARAAETISGGKLLVASFGANDRHRCCDGLYDVLNDALLELRDSGRLDPESYRRLIFPIYFRSREELVAPVVQADSPAAAWFHVDRVESMEVPVPFTQRWEDTGDVTFYAQEFTGFLRAFTEPILRLSFAGQAGVDALLAELYQRVQARLVANPENYEFHYIQVAALLTRL